MIARIQDEILLLVFLKAGLFHGQGVAIRLYSVEDEFAARICGGFANRSRAFGDQLDVNAGDDSAMRVDHNSGDRTGDGLR